MVRLNRLKFSKFTLIPKKGAERIQYLRPIGIISKILANWLSKILNSLISRSQSAFIKGMMILDSVAYAQKVFFPTQRRQM